MKEGELRALYPLHSLVWENDIAGLRQLLSSDDAEQLDIDKVDVRGRSPLMLAVTLGRPEAALLLLRAGANADTQNKEKWCVSHEAISSGDVRLLREVLKYRDFQRAHRATNQMRVQLLRLKDSPDFYAEMSWEFASWVPFVSKLCPSDTYKIYKSGSSVRIDTTLVGFSGHSWQRGRQSFVFRLSDQYNEDQEAPLPQIVVLDHQTETATVQTLTTDDILADFEPTEEGIDFRMTSPVSTTYIDIDKIGFERSKPILSMSWIGSGEKKERVSGYDCRIFNASNVDLVTKTRSEHLSEEQRARFKQEEGSNPLSSLLNMVRSENASDEGATTASAGIGVDGGLTLQQYLDPDFQPIHDIVIILGRPRAVTRKSNSFKATLWLAEDYPLSLQEQVAPIVNLMSSSSAHFARLHSFIRLQLPAGFPVKIEIPLFHVVSAKITFGRINEPGPLVEPIMDSGDKKALSLSSDGVPLLASASTVAIDPKVFEIPSGYRTLDDRQSGMSTWWPDESSTSASSNSGVTSLQPRRYVHPSAQQQEEMLLQLAIEQSLLSSQTLEQQEKLGEQLNEAGNGHLPSGTAAPRRPLAVTFASESDMDEDDRQLALAIQRSLQEMHAETGTSSSSSDRIRRRAPTPVDEGSQFSDLAASDRAGLGMAGGNQGLPSWEDDELTMALRLSAKEAEDARRREEEEEEEMLRQVIERSMQEQ